MGGNNCPKCGGAVMTYPRFFREAEPNRPSPCGSCGTMLRRSPMAWVLIVVMGLLLLAACIGLLNATLGGLAIWKAGVLGVLLFLVWIPLTNALGFLLVSWIPNEPKV